MSFVMVVAEFPVPKTGPGTQEVLSKYWLSE